MVKLRKTAVEYPTPCGWGGCHYKKPVAVNAGLTSNADWITARLYSSFPRCVFIHSEILRKSYQLETDNDILSFKIRDKERSGILIMMELKKEEF